MEEILHSCMIVAIPSAIKRLVGDILNPKERIHRICFYTGTIKGVEEGKTASLNLVSMVSLSYETIKIIIT
jgi:hypothetical protein